MEYNEMPVFVKIYSQLAKNLYNRELKYLEHAENVEKELNYEICHVVPVICFGNQDGELSDEIKEVVTNNNLENWTEFDYIVMPFYKNGDLFDTFINTDFEVDDVKILFKHILCSVLYLHTECGLAHLDIKLENIMLDDNKMPVLIDLEFAKKTHLRTGGTQGYSAPEVELAREIKHQNAKSDVFSLGVLLYVLLHSSYPLPKEGNTHKMLSLIEKNPIQYFRDRLDAKFLEEEIFAYKLIAKMIHPEPDKRPFVKDIIQHPWFNNPYSN